MNARVNNLPNNSIQQFHNQINTNPTQKYPNTSTCLCFWFVRAEVRKKQGQAQQLQISLNLS